MARPTSRPRDLVSVLAKFRRDYEEMYDSSLDGHCDAFAIALAEALGTSDPEPYLIIQRTRTGEDTGRVLDDNPLSHVALGYAGETWDSSGPEAFERWEENWVQPDADEEVEPSRDTFEGVWLSQQKMRDLRRQRDSRPPSAQHIAKFKAALRSCGIESVVAAGPRRST